MTHTEGPWIACRPGESDWSKNYWEIEDPYGHTATVYGNDGEAEANAHLVAAAPELLAACKYLLENAEAAGWSDFMLADVRAAIAKAEGRGDDQ